MAASRTPHRDKLIDIVAKRQRLVGSSEERSPRKVSLPRRRGIERISTIRTFMGLIGHGYLDWQPQDIGVTDVTVALPTAPVIDMSRPTMKPGGRGSEKFLPNWI